MLLFLYEHVLDTPVGHVEHVVRAKVPLRLPVVLSREEVATVLAHLEGAIWIIGVLLYGSGLRLEECLRLTSCSSVTFLACYYPHSQ